MYIVRTINFDISSDVFMFEWEKNISISYAMQSSQHSATWLEFVDPVHFYWYLHSPV